jgi:hypothetical protein
MFPDRSRTLRIFWLSGAGSALSSNADTQKPLHLRWWRGFDLRFHVPNMSAHEGIRTPNLLIRSQMLYPLSYARVRYSVVVSPALTVWPVLVTWSSVHGWAGGLKIDYR